MAHNDSYNPERADLDDPGKQPARPWLAGVVQSPYGQVQAASPCLDT